MNNATVHVLLVEDNELDVQGVQRAFDTMEVTNKITVAKNGIEAFQILRGENGHARLRQPFVILLDMQLPGMSGIEFLHLLRQDAELKNSIVFILTVTKNEQTMFAAYSSQVAGYILKKNVGKEFLGLPDLLRNYWRLVEWPHPM